MSIFLQNDTMITFNMVRTTTKLTMIEKHDILTKTDEHEQVFKRVITLAFYSIWLQMKMSAISILDLIVKREFSKIRSTEKCCMNKLSF